MTNAEAPLSPSLPEESERAERNFRVFSLDVLTGRHGIFLCYGAFIHIVDSMFNQHAKWLKVSREIAWRWPIEEHGEDLPEIRNWQWS